MARWQRKQRRTDSKRRHEPPRPTERPPWPAEQPRSSEPPASTSKPQVVVRKADVVVRLAYTPTQAAQALGVSRSSLYRFLPYLETIETPSGHPLIPVDELERVAAERREAALARRPAVRSGRKPSIPPRVLVRIRATAICTWEQRSYSGAQQNTFPFVGGHEIAGALKLSCGLLVQIATSDDGSGIVTGLSTSRS